MDEPVKYVKENAGKVVEVLANRIKVARHDTLYLNCPWCDGKVDVVDRWSATLTVECPQCGLTIEVVK